MAKKSAASNVNVSKVNVSNVNADTSHWLTIEEYSKYEGVSTETIRKRLREGKIPDDARSKRPNRVGRASIIIDAEKASAAYARYFDPAQAARSQAAMEVRRAKGQITQIGATANPLKLKEADPESYSEAMRQKEWELVRRERLRNDISEGRVIEIDKARTMWETVFHTIREQILGLSDKLAQTFAAMQDAKEIRIRMNAELRQALSALPEKIHASIEKKLAVEDE